MKPTLEFIEEIARQAGGILQSFVGEDLDVQHKSRTDLVTRADHASEDYLIGEIRKAFPDHAINAEESGSLEGTPDHQWFYRSPRWHVELRPRRAVLFGLDCLCLSGSG